MVRLYAVVAPNNRSRCARKATLIYGGADRPNTFAEGGQCTSREQTVLRAYGRKAVCRRRRLRECCAVGEQVVSLSLLLGRLQERLEGLIDG